MRRLSIAAIAIAGLALAVSAQEELPGDLEIVPRHTGTANPMQSGAAPPLPNPIVDDVRVGRSYPEQPPVIPHSIDGYQPFPTESAAGWKMTPEGTSPERAGWFRREK